MTLHTDPDKLRDWQRRSKPLSRTVPLGRAPLATVTPLRSVGLTAPVVPLRPGRASPRDTIPAKVRTLVRARDENLCVHCGRPADDIHHRRLKGIGGSSDAHANCPCLLVSLCRACHDWAHANRREAEAEGLIIPRATPRPWLLPVLVHGYGDGGGQTAWPSCDAHWLPEEPEGDGAA